ncbi:MAG: dienelactone hydrolase family protein, partial [Limibacillus sp.]
MVAVARRSILRGAASLPLATILARPSLVRAAAGETERVTITRPSGREVSGALAMPDALPAPTVLLIHEWWGLNDHIKTMATEFATQGYIALAVDLYGGEVAMTGDRDAAQSQMQGVDAGEATET